MKTRLFVLALLAALAAPSIAFAADCGIRGCYVNREGVSVPRPQGDWHTQEVPPGATARCRDGTYSFSRHPTFWGTCSHHGGVQNYVSASERPSAAQPKPFKLGPGDPPERPIPVFAKERPL